MIRLLSLLLVQVWAQQPIVKTSLGPVAGFYQDGIRKFLGIPYAQPPIGNLRFMPPVAPEPWTEPFNATSYTLPCPQTCTLPSVFCPSQTSEDCLHLNVYTPAELSTTTLYPVMVFIFGGGYINGDSETPAYWPFWDVNASQTIQVTFDYRLGAFGFLTNTYAGLAGNQAILDQLMVLNWVQENIANFGGDPTRVTLYGESAGAMSTAIHLISPSSAGLFSAAILESDPFALQIPDYSDNYQRTVAFAKALGCSPNDLSCLQGASASAVNDASNSVSVWPNLLNMSMTFVLPWRPTVNTPLVPGQILTQISAGQWNKVPIMLGSNTNEGTLFVYQAASFMDNVMYDAALLAIFGDDVGKVRSMYPSGTLNPITDVRPVFSQLLTDWLFACPARYVAAAVAAQKLPAFLYHFDYVSPSGSKVWGSQFQYCWDLVCHGAELPFVFDSAEWIGFTTDTQGQQLGQTMATYWSNFAATHNPNNGDPVPWKWPQFLSPTNLNLHLTVGQSAPEQYRSIQCAFWDAMGYYW